MATHSERMENRLTKLREKQPKKNKKTISHTQCLTCHETFFDAKTLSKHREQNICKSNGLQWSLNWAQRNGVWFDHIPEQKKRKPSPVQPIPYTAIRCVRCSQWFADVNVFSLHLLHTFNPTIERCMDKHEMSAADWGQSKAGVWSFNILSMTSPSQISRLASIRQEREALGEDYAEPPIHTPAPDWQPDNFCRTCKTGHNIEVQHHIMTMKEYDTAFDDFKSEQGTKCNSGISAKTQHKSNGQNVTL